MTSTRFSGFTRLLFLLSGITGSVYAQPLRPNIILFLADDMGFSDLGCYGSEIKTPHLDRLAREGVRFSSMYNSARCCPSRFFIGNTN